MRTHRKTHIAGYTANPAVYLKAVNERRDPICGSRIFGEPYLPEGFSYPLGSDGEPLMFLGQLNFTELPHLDGFPDKGVLQFYISSRKAAYGANLDNLTDQGYFRVAYHADTALRHSGKLHRVLGYSEIPVTGIYVADPLRPDADVEAVFDGPRLMAHHVGGQPYLIQLDPRRIDQRYAGHSVLLLQICSDAKNRIQWFDGGTLSFYIRPEDLTRLDFSNVIFNVDSH